jgi:hypothetical protein
MGAQSGALRPSKIRGVQLAIVVENADGGDNPGYRVKLKLPWLTEQDTTFWARIAVPMGGAGRGTYVLPEIDDQVLVVFEHGDVHRPIVIGALWSKKQEPVEINGTGKNNTKLIKSRSGHRIIFDDKEGSERVVIVDKTTKNKIVLDSANKVVKIESDGDIEVIAKANVIMHSNALKVGTSQTVSGKGRSLLTHATKTFGLKATSSITVGGGNTTINVSNAAATSVSGSGSGELGAPGEDKPKDQVTGGSGGGGQAGSGAGGASPSGGGTASGNSGAASTVTAVTPTPTSFVVLILVDQDNQPFGGQRYRITAPDGTVREGMLDDQGKARVDGLAQGTCQVSFPDLADDDWAAA